MKERPIIFSGEMVRAILDGRKTQTRRVMKPQPTLDGRFWKFGGAGWSDGVNRVTPMYGHSLYYACPYGVPGDRLWVRERWVTERQFDHLKPRDIPSSARLTERIKYTGFVSNWDMVRSPIHMPRWASRITLEVVSVRVERVQDISPKDCESEGVGKDLNDIGWRYAFGSTWNAINEKRGYGWDANPWVWVIEFKRIATEDRG